MTTAAHRSIAASRFGLGPRAGELAGIGSDPRGWLLAQVGPEHTPPPAPASLAGGAEALRLAIALRSGQFAGRQERAPDGSPLPNPAVRAYREEVAILARHWTGTAQPFRERLVAFWANHFTVSVQRPFLRPLVGAYVRQAIRPHVTGRFADMLVAVARHPAMLLYLDNAISIGPGSPAGARSGRGLNENLAREILELHTLGVDGGYTQADVTEFARILTGWSVPRPADGYTGEQTFLFRWLAHDPGSKTLLGRTYPVGEEGGVKALRDLARHPATARHLATKLVRHFVADDPPPPAAARIAAAFRDSDGDLGAVAAALVALPEAWAEPLPKLRTPQELVVAALRALGDPGRPDAALGAFAVLGQPAFAAPSPAGWPDIAGAWAGPEAIMRRIDWAHALAGRLGPGRAPLDLFAETIAPLASAATAQAIRRAPDTREALTLLFAAPEFQRR